MFNVRFATSAYLPHYKTTAMTKFYLPLLILLFGCSCNHNENTTQAIKWQTDLERMHLFNNVEFIYELRFSSNDSIPITEVCQFNTKGMLVESESIYPGN